MTVLEAVNGPGTSSPNVTHSGRMDLSSSQYVKIDGVYFDGGADIGGTNYIYLKNSGFYSPTDTASGGALDMGGADYALVEDCWAWGRRRTQVMNDSSDYNILRRVVIRRESSNGTVNIGYHCYMCKYIVWQNCIAVDGVGTSYAYADFGQATRSSSNGHGGNRYMGCVSINSDTYGFRLDDNDASHITVNNPMARLQHCAAIDPTSSGIYAPGAADARVDTENCTIYQVNGSGDGLRTTDMSAGGYTKNHLAFGDGGASGLRSSYGVDYSNANGSFTSLFVGGGSNQITSDPENDGTPASIKYPLRIESGSVLETHGEGGGVCGAHIVKRYGVEGTFYGESGWDTLTDENLWPFPNQELIRAQMRITSSAVADPTRGFCADGETLTHYIWNTLGNGSPYEEVQPASVTPGVAAVSVTCYTPSIQTGGAQSVTPGVSACTATGYTPVIDIPSEAILVPGDYSTIQDAIDAASPGDVVLVDASQAPFNGVGTSPGFHFTESGTSDALPIEVRGDGQVVINSDGPVYPNGCRVQNSKYIVVDNFRFTTGITGRAVACRGAGPTEETSNKGVKFKRVLVDGWGANEGMYLSETWAGELEDVEVDGTNGPGGTRCHNIYIANAGSKNMVLTRVNSHDAWGSDSHNLHMNGDLSTGGDGLITGMVTSDSFFQNCAAASGVNMDGVRDCEWNNVVATGNARHGFRGYGPIDGDGADGPSGHVWNGCTMDDNGSWAVKLTEDDGGHTVMNSGLLSDSGSLCVGNVDIKSDYNLMTNTFSTDEESSTISLSSWQSATGEDANSNIETATAIWTDPTNDDYTIIASGPADGTGVDSFNGISKTAEDITGATRGSPPSIGAYE
jgi:hypothetical protein